MPAPGIRSVVEFPLKLLEAPFVVVGGMAGWLADRAERGRWVPTAQRLQVAVAKRGVRPTVGGQGPNSGLGPSATLGWWPHGARGRFALLQGGLTQRGYWLTQLRAGTDALDVGVRVEERSRDVFFGIGNATREEDWADYRLHRVSAGAHLKVQPAASWRLMAGLEWARTSTSAGGDGAHIDIDSAFSSAGRPGFGITYQAISPSAGLEYRAGAPHAIERRGSWIASQYRWSGSRTSGVADFGVWRAGAGFELPFDHRRRSVVLAVSVESLRRTSSGVVPFYVLPTLGGARSLPSFRTERFRDRDALLGMFEYRYRVWSEPGDALWIDAVLFTDAGVVAPRVFDALTTARVHQSTGFGIAVLGRGTALGRIAVSKGADGVGITFVMSGGF
ncbi:MAG TPA: hypothetical protein VGJ80_12970 [Gemmatimonadales bacterium]|jgi:hypothetical protein